MQVQPPITWMLLFGGVALAVLIAFAVISIAIAWLVFRRKPDPAPEKTWERLIDLTALEARGAPADGPRLEYYGCPVRLAVLVLAPVGRDGSIPEKEQLPELLEQFVPQFLQVVAAHQPLLQFWPAQVSAVGFTNAFFSNVALPGDRGKGTPWCGIAGRFMALGKPYLAGIICCDDNATGLGQLILEHEGQWRDVLRVKI